MPASKKYYIKRVIEYHPHHLRDAILSPVEVSFHFLCGSHAICKIILGGFETALSQSVQFEDFSVFGI